MPATTDATPTRRAVFRGIGLTAITAGLTMPTLASAQPHGADADRELLRLEPAFEAAEAEVTAAWAIGNPPAICGFWLDCSLTCRRWGVPRHEARIPPCGH